MWTFRATVLRIIDGDTLELQVDRGERIYTTGIYRLHGVNAPEMRGEEREKGLRARDWLEQRIPVDCEVAIETHKQGKFGRYLVTLWDADPDEGSARCINSEMYNLGYAKPYDGKGQMDRFPADEVYPLTAIADA